MIEPRLFLCGGTTVADGEREGRFIDALDTAGGHPNVTIKIDDVARVFTRRLSDRLVDFLEIAAYAFAADAKTTRGSGWEDGAIEPWQRDFRFVIPVADVAFWRKPETTGLLVATLGFLTNDRFSFDFVPMVRPRMAQEYLDFGAEEWPFDGIDRVTMFSGGMDSLAGAVEMAAAGLPMVLVSHRSVPPISSRQRRLVQALRQRYPLVPILHVPVWVNKSGKTRNEPTQRTRSFLFTALGLAVGEMVQAGGLDFYENGVVSLNLPVADEAIRARSSRTSHPYALQLLAKLAGQVVDRPFSIENPYLLKTKAEIAAIVGAHDPSLIAQSVSCAHTIFKSKTQQHCGTCSQCIDRRVGLAAAGLTDADSLADYVSDVFTGPRAQMAERNIAVHFARHATELARMSEDVFAARFNVELSRAVRGAANAALTCQAFYELHQRHAESVTRVLAAQIEANAGALVAGRVPPTSMIGLIAGQRHELPMWQSYAERVGDILQGGLPKACEKNAPDDEPHLQRLADAILTGQEEPLVREFPFMRWSASATKPDWSNDTMGLWVEMKYVRTKSGIRRITEDIAADITKYGDNGRRVLFVVYDPKHLVTDEHEFAQDIVAHDSMRVRFIR